VPESTSRSASAGAPLAAPVILEYRKALHRWLTRRLRNPDVADDVAQEVFLRLHCVERAKLIRDPLPYLYGIAFKVISALRASQRRNCIVFDSELAARWSENLKYEATAESDWDALEQELEKAVAELPTQYRRVLLLCKRDGLSYEQAALASGLSVHTVEKYLVRARARVMAFGFYR
jgi:RNA polymerase sigma factor (sigma-70 family)